MLSKELKEICQKNNLDDSIHNELLELMKKAWINGLHSCPCDYNKKK